MPAIGSGQFVSIGIGTITAAIGSTTISMSTISARSGSWPVLAQRVIGNSTHADDREEDHRLAAEGELHATACPPAHREDRQTPPP